MPQKGLEKRTFSKKGFFPSSSDNLCRKQSKDFYQKKQNRT